MNLFCLVKPQFEATNQEIAASKGIIKNERLRIEIVKRVLRLIRKLGFLVTELITSPIAGVKGNVEYLIHFERIKSRENSPRFSREIVLELVFSDVI